MSNPRELWWPYVKNVIRAYPKRKEGLDTLRASHRREFDAVDRAIREAQAFPDAKIRLSLIRLLYWTSPVLTIDAAAQLLSCSKNAATHLQRNFAYRVAAYLGLWDEQETAPPVQYVASISYGKDSLAMLEMIFQNGMPLNRIVHVEILAAAGVPADLPEVMAWKQYADDIILKRYGIPVEHITAGKTFEDLFYSIPQRTEKNRDIQGTILGFPSLRSQWCSKALKVEVMRRHFQGSVQYIGIAADEPDRFGQLNNKVRSPLVEHGITEPECLEICKRLGLLAPIYLQSKRSGCWFCPAQPIKQLRLLRQQHPELWTRLLAWDKDSPIPFRHGGNSGTHTVHDFEKRFSYEDEHNVSGIKPFKWRDVTS